MQVLSKTPANHLGAHLVPPGRNIEKILRHRQQWHPPWQIERKAHGPPTPTYGETDELGFAPIAQPLHVHDLNATILHLMGLDHEKLTFKYQGRDFRLTDVHGTVAYDLMT